MEVTNASLVAIFFFHFLSITRILDLHSLFSTLCNYTQAKCSLLKSLTKSIKLLISHCFCFLLDDLGVPSPNVGVGVGVKLCLVEHLVVVSNCLGMACTTLESPQVIGICLSCCRFITSRMYKFIKHSNLQLVLTTFMVFKKMVHCLN